MNEVWNLDPIYKGFDDPAFEAELAEAKHLVAEYAAFTAALSDADPAEGLRKGIDLQEKITCLISKLLGYCSLRQSTNTRDAQAGSNMGRVMSVYSGVAAPQAAFQSWAAKLPNLMMPGGQLFNLKFSPDSADSEEGLSSWLGLIKGAFNKKAMELQFNIVSADTLRSAQVTPENYKDLVVRVAGYSGYFVELRPEVQEDIILRTEHEL